jgi:hypothetical protein
MDEFLADIADDLDAFKAACAEVVTCRCPECRKWLNMRGGDDDGELASCHFVTLCELIGRMGEVGRVEAAAYADAATVLAKAIDAESHEVIVEVCRIAEAAMREQIAMPERN